MSDYLTVADVMAIHADLIERYGGAPGLRDAELLEAAIFRPQSGYYSDVLEEAAALWESLSQNHAFVDGNKRAAFGSVYAFLAINDFTIAPDADAIHEFMMRLYERGEFSFDNLLKWLRSSTRRN